MIATEYLDSVLAAQNLSDESAEMTELQKHRAEVEGLLREAFGTASPTIRYGGSKAKGTLIRESYDLDLVCYFPSGENGAGATLKEIFENVGASLAEHYSVSPKTSALRLHSSDMAYRDFHIDVVPGRFTDDSKSDSFLFQNGADKERLKTNLQVHIDLIRDAGVTPALRLLKLWRVRQGLPLKNFVWELLCIRLLQAVKSKPLDQQIAHVLESVAAADRAIPVEDPANPQGNDLMPVLNDLWGWLRAAAGQTLQNVAVSGWEGVFGQVEVIDQIERSSRLATAASAVVSPTKPWAG